MATVILMRHGETTWNRDRRMQGWAPVPLTERGVEQARAAGRYLGERYSIDRVVSSDLLRTRQTTARVREALGDVPVTFAREWRERSVGVYQGLSYDDMRERFPEFGLGEEAAHAADRTPDGGESLETVRERVLEGWRAVLEHDGTTLVVTHGGPIRLALGHLKGHTIPDALLSHRVDNCCLNEFVVASDPEIRVENGTPWRDSA
ncbi:histidine phosphatase family protein [Halomarina pelagica]|uniref:histidine phosphatase family protein n=1 Tax=Halomarina pelagica TaxID=2961599 RepID=UPI0020C4E5FD|nr:histidine phosphatase family protein [Halomarina sp. BND7]